MDHEPEAPHRDRIDMPTLVVINLLLAVIAAALFFGPLMIFYAALVLSFVGLALIVALSRGFGQPAL